MRQVIVMVTCDLCKDKITEETEGANAIRLSMRGEEREMDVCDECLTGSFLQEARPVTNRKKRKAKKFPCDSCDSSFDTERGLNHHKTRMHGEA